MPISNFPAALQPIIQLGYLEREFEQAFHSRLGYRAVADRMSFSVGIGETLTKTRAGLKSAVTDSADSSSETTSDLPLRKLANVGLPLQMRRCGGWLNNPIADIQPMNDRGPWCSKATITGLAGSPGFSRSS